MQRILTMRRCILLASLAWTLGMSWFGSSVVQLADLPPAARVVLQQQAKGRPILAITTRAGAGGDVVYEALVAGADADVNVAVDQRGHVVARFIQPRARGLDDR